MDRETTLNYLAQKHGLNLSQKPPIEILTTNRTIMAQTLFELGFTTGAEVGVAKGDHALILCANNPNLKLYAIDVWDTYAGYNEYTDRIHRYHRHALRALAPYNVTFIQKFSMDAVKDFEDASLDFVYLDGAHDFKNIAMDICEWVKKVKPGGILYGHDFKRTADPRLQIHVKDVVQAYAYSHGISPWFILGAPGHHDGQYAEGTRSWGWVC